MTILETQKSVDEISEIACDTMGDKPTREGVEIKPMDVLCGRGKKSFNHSGNHRFRTIVDEVLPSYLSATSRTEKSEIVTSIVGQVREVGGRFLKRDGKRDVWYVLNYTQSKEKAGHAIRDATITEDSKKERAKKRKLQRAAAAKNSRKKDEQKRCSPSVVVTPEKSQSSFVPEEFMAPQFMPSKYDLQGKYDPDEMESSFSIKAALSANLKKKQQNQPLDIPSMDLAPIPLDSCMTGDSFTILDDSFLGLEPFMDYIDEVLGPAPTL